MSKLGAVSARQTGTSRWRQRFQFAAKHLVNTIFPPLCPICREHIGADGGVCTTCWAELSFIEAPLCDRLGTPFAFDPGPGIVSSTALAHPPRWARARGAVEFDDTARTLVHALKYRDQLHTAGLMARLMARAGRELWRDADVLVPVPLYRLRLWQRRFNQSALLAQKIQTYAGILSNPGLLSRTRPTQAQVGLDFASRKQNVRGAFEVPEHMLPAISGKNCVLVDDVMTTGSTANACTKALLKAGAQRVDVIVFALVLNPSESHI